MPQYFIPRFSGYDLYHLSKIVRNHGFPDVHEESENGGNNLSVVVFSSPDTPDQVKAKFKKAGIPQETIKEKTWGKLPELQSSQKIHSALNIGDSFILEGTIEGEPVSITVEIVDGDKVREEHPDFTGGGNWKAYPWMPDNTVYLEKFDNPEAQEDEAEVFGHEIDELFDMIIHDEEYKPAHEAANEKEGFRRKLTEKAGLSMVANSKIQSERLQSSVYRDYKIQKGSDGNYTVKTPKGETWREKAVNLETAKKWVDADLIERREHDRRKAFEENVKRSGDDTFTSSRRILWQGRQGLTSASLQKKEDYLAKKKLNRKMEVYQDNDQHFVTDDMGEKTTTAKNFLTQSVNLNVLVRENEAKIPMDGGPFDSPMTLKYFCQVVGIDPSELGELGNEKGIYVGRDEEGAYWEAQGAKTYIDSSIASAIDWEKAPSVREGGKSYFWVATKTPLGKMTIVWDRNANTWKLEGDQTYDSAKGYGHKFSYPVATEQEGKQKAESLVSDGIASGKSLTSARKDEVIESLMNMIISYYDGKADAGRYLDSFIDLYGPDDSYDKDQMRSHLEKRDTDKFLNDVLNSASLEELQNFLDSNILSKFAVGDIVLKKTEEITSAFKAGQKVALKVNKALKGVVDFIHKLKEGAQKWDSYVVKWFDGTQSTEPETELIPAHVLLRSGMFQSDLEDITTSLVEEGLDLSPEEIRRLTAEYFMSIKAFDTLAAQYGLDQWERGVFKDVVRKLRGKSRYSFEPANSAVGNAGAGAAKAMGTPGTGVDGTGKSTQTAIKPADIHDLKLNPDDKRKKKKTMSGLLDIQTHSHNPIAQAKLPFDQWKDNMVFCLGKIADTKTYQAEIASELQHSGEREVIDLLTKKPRIVPSLLNDLSFEFLNEYDESKGIKAHVRISSPMSAEQRSLVKAALITEWASQSVNIKGDWQIEEPLRSGEDLVLYFPLPNDLKNIDGVQSKENTLCYMDGHEGKIMNDLQDGRVVVSWDDGLWSVEKLVALASSNVSSSVADSYIKRYDLKEFVSGLRTEMAQTQKIDTAFQLTSDHLDREAISYIKKKKDSEKEKQEKIKSGLLRYRI
jgi:hypothetical protein